MSLQTDKTWLCVLLICMIPALSLVFDIAFNCLGSNPIEALHIRLGDWALRFLWLTLAITPIQTITKWRGMANYRQLLGLTAFTYASLHVMVYLVVDHVLEWQMIFIDIIESRYIWFGIVCYLILLVLAITSPKAAKKKLGKNWKKLHRLIYLAAITAILHYFWQLKGNLAEPVFYFLMMLFLFAFRIATQLNKK